MISRRNFLKLSAIAGVGLVLPFEWLANAPRVLAFSQSDRLTKFNQALRKIGGGGTGDIHLAVKDDPLSNPGWWQPGVDHYTIDIGQFTDKLHPDLPNETRLWGYGQGFNEDVYNPHWTKHLSGVIAAKRGTPVQITFRNHLPADHILPIDLTIMGADEGVNRACVHLHGGLAPWTSDGGPHAWWDPTGGHGVDFLNNQVLRPNQIVPANEAEYYYPNDQGSRLLWYHDHTLGNTRLNAYAGVASGYVIYDDYELNTLAKAPINLPFAVDERTVYLAFQDKIFVSADIDTKDPTWKTVVDDTQTGDLWYAHVYDPVRWDLTPGMTPPPISAIPEFFGDTILVNGTVYPYLEVGPRQYRFRMLNACNARFLNPHLVLADSTKDNKEPALDANFNPIQGPEFLQIGNEGGFLPYPVVVNGPLTPQPQIQLLMAPAERTDLIVDFRGKAGKTYLLYSDAAAPFPMGDSLNDYYPGNIATPSATPGKGPNTRTLLQIRVSLPEAVDPVINLPLVLTPTDRFVVDQFPGEPTPIPAGVHVRRLTLNESNDAFGRLIQFLGTDEPLDLAKYGFGRPYDADPTEVIYEGTTEVWEILNLTGDVHPIHFHLVNVQVLSRQLFDADHYTGGAPSYFDEAYPPEQNELGWKETVRMNPGEVTRVIMKFDLPVTPFVVPESPRTGGYEYVWHCHILEHEEHDMMRPLIIKYHKNFMPLIKK